MAAGIHSGEKVNTDLLKDQQLEVYSLVSGPKSLLYSLHPSILKKWTEQTIQKYYYRVRQEE